jgi:predicted DsbA family dithiol-disulfide isomerase
VHDVIVFSDYICPFCYVGKKRFERLASELPLRPVWKGFEIHPEVPPEGIPLSQFMPDILTALEAGVRALAEEEGLEMHMPQKLANSRLALLGGEFAREAGKLDDYHEAVFSAYFQHGGDIGDIAVLADIADRIGLDSDRFTEALSNETNLPELRDSVRQAHSLGLRAVPSFVFADNNIIVGVQPYAAFQAAAAQSLRTDPEEE